MEKSLIDLWANFLYNEKLDPTALDDEADILLLVHLAEEMAKVRGPKIREYKLKLESRRFVCETAINLGIDLPAIKKHGKVAMGRGLLDMWNKVYTEKFGSTIGTKAAWEAKRRDVKTMLTKQGIKGVKR